MEPRLILFAKSPVAGKVKTRMQPQLSAGQAAGLAIILIRETVAAAHRHWRGDIELKVSPDLGDPLFDDLEKEFGVILNRQSTGDLGEKMYRALCAAGQPSAIMGTDVPHCPGRTWREAQQRLIAGDNVVGPAEDGGYYLIGLQTPERRLFTGIDWGRGSVLEDTCRRAEQFAQPLHRLPTLRDVDDWQDLLAVRPALPAIDRFLNGLVGHDR